MAGKKVTKNDLVDSILQNTDIKIEKEDILKIVDSLFCEVKKSLCQGSTIELRGFGTFEPSFRQAKKHSRNPKTGEKVEVPQHYVAGFKAGKDLKEKLWNLNKSDNE